MELLPLQQTFIPSNLNYVDKTLPNVFRATPCRVNVEYDDYSLKNFLISAMVIVSF